MKKLPKSTLIPLTILTIAMFSGQTCYAQSSYFEPVHCGFVQKGDGWEVSFFRLNQHQTSTTNFKKKKIGGNNLHLSAFEAFEESLNEDRSLKIRSIIYETNSSLVYDKNLNIDSSGNFTQSTEFKTLKPGGWVAYALRSDDGGGRHHLQRDVILYPKDDQNENACKDLPNFWKLNPSVMEKDVVSSQR